MSRFCLFALLGAMIILAGGLEGQEPKKDDPPAKLKGKLPSHWGKIGLTDAQKQTIYQIQAKYDPEIEKLEAKVTEMKSTKDKEMKAVLNADQKKALEAALLGTKEKEKDKDKDK